MPSRQEVVVSSLGKSMSPDGAGSTNSDLAAADGRETLLSGGGGAEESRPIRERLWSTALAAFVAAIPSILVGYTLGFASTALLDLTGNGVGDIRGDYVFGSTIADVFAALAPVGGMFGGILSGLIADKWGRKDALVLCGIPYFVGYMSLSYAHYLPTAAGFKATVLIGRFLTGVGMGWACMSGSVYIGEISSAKCRGFFGSFIQIGLSAGILVNYAVGSIPEFPYYYNSLVAAGIAAVFEVFMVMLYDTPRWLVTQGHLHKACKSLRWFRGPHADISAEIKSIESAQGTKATLKTTLREFRKRSVVVPLVLVIFVMFFQQIGGINAISSYAASIFEQAGLDDPRATATYAVGGVQLATVAVAVFFVDYVGRKLLLILSAVGTMAGALLLGVDFYLTRPSLCSHESLNSTLLSSQLDSDGLQACDPQYGPLAVVSVVIFGIGFSIGWGPIPWVLVSELTALQVRGVASGIATVVSWGSAAIVTGFYTAYSDAVHPWVTWWSFMLSNAAALVFSILFLRETKGKSLEEIEKYYQKNIF